MYKKEKEEYQKMKKAIDHSTLLLDEKAIETGRAINEAHRLIGERNALIAVYEKETGLTYDKDITVDIDQLIAMKTKHEDEINASSRNVAIKKKNTGTVPR